MNLEDLITEMKKIKYHIRVLSEAIDHQSHPVEALILSMDWTEAEIERAHDIFEKYDTKIEEGETINWKTFEIELEKEFGISYQTVKSIINAFYRNHQWTRVCHGYAMSFEPTTPVEFHHITRSAT